LPIFRIIVKNDGFAAVGDTSPADQFHEQEEDFLQAYRFGLNPDSDTVTDE
jgi:hypothetical protein